MKRLALLVIFAAIAGALVAYLRRHSKAAVPAAEPNTQAVLPVDPDRPGAAPDPEAREQESAVTRDTRFDRLADEEREARRDAVRRLQADPLDERRAGGEAEEE